MSWIQNCKCSIVETDVEMWEAQTRIVVDGYGNFEDYICEDIPRCTVCGTDFIHTVSEK